MQNVIGCARQNWKFRGFSEEEGVNLLKRVKRDLERKKCCQKKLEFRALLFLPPFRPRPKGSKSFFFQSRSKKTNGERRRKNFSTLSFLLLPPPPFLLPFLSFERRLSLKRNCFALPTSAPFPLSSSSFHTLGITHSGWKVEGGGRGGGISFFPRIPSCENTHGMSSEKIPFPSSVLPPPSAHTTPTISLLFPLAPPITPRTLIAI